MANMLPLMFSCRLPITVKWFCMYCLDMYLKKEKKKHLLSFQTNFPITWLFLSGLFVLSELQVKCICGILWSMFWTQICFTKGTKVALMREQWRRKRKAGKNPYITSQSILSNCPFQRQIVKTPAAAIFSQCSSRIRETKTALMITHNLWWWGLTEGKKWITFS